MREVDGRPIRRFAHVLVVACAALPALLQAFPGQAQPDVPPDSKGVYYRESPSEWGMLDPAMLSDSRSHGMERFVETGGMTGLNVILTFDGSNSPVQIGERRPKFFVRGFLPGEDTLIVQLAVRRDSREAQTSLSLAGMTNREGFKNADIHRVVVTAVDKSLYTITPQETLKPGEYLLVLGRVETSFNFGISK
jgi:hypothetical protein